MRIIPFSISVLITLILILVFDTKLLLRAPLGRLLSPQHGIWQNAEPASKNFSEELKFPALKGRAQVYFDERLVPHVFAEQESDIFFIQGYLHAKFRLWQMEFQTHAAAGRLSEIFGEKMGDINCLEVVDRYFRRLGIGYAAEKSLQLIENDPDTRPMCDAYTAGVNAWIQSLNQSQLPLEYKLLDYTPEPWTNLKSSLMIKYMAFDLAGYETDFEFTAARNALSKSIYQKLFPLYKDSTDPIIPKGTLYDYPGLQVNSPATADSLYFTYSRDTAISAITSQKPDRDNGSNNWALAGGKTKSGYPILCNDPHLSLSLPAIWYEMQLHTPAFNSYGVSLLGVPSILIGFNDDCAMGLTNAGRDVRDYYSIQFKDASHKFYLFNGEWKQTEFRYEKIKVKGKNVFTDTVAYTVFGPVIFDEQYGNKIKDGKCYAVRWTAHDPSNEIKAIYKMSRIKNYQDYLTAIQLLETPGQNIAFASKNGDIALWCQGSFPAKWKRQGDYIMPGTDSSYMWKGMIPQSENPHQYNPERGFVSSANQVPADTSYPYYLGSAYDEYRGITINRMLSTMQNITVGDMMQMQTDNYNVFAETARPLLNRYMVLSKLNNTERKYWELFRNWNLRNDSAEKGATVFVTLWDSLEAEILNDELKKAKLSVMADKTSKLVGEGVLLENLLRDSSFLVDNITTGEKETLQDDLLAAFKKAVVALKHADETGNLAWVKFKDTRIAHLLRIPALGRYHLPVGGGKSVINATKQGAGPSWRMIVHLTPETEAYGIYPGGQSGNPGSKYYDTFINDWAAGKYYRLWVMNESEVNDKRVKWIMNFSN